MTSQPTPESPGPPGARRRRSSFAEIFQSRPNLSTSTSSSPPNAPTSIPKPQHSRGVSISTLGLSGSSPTQGSPFNAFARQRRASIATSSGSGSPQFRNSFGDEPAVLEDGDATNVPENTPVSPSFARRVSFGAQALRDVKQGGSVTGSGGRRPSLFTLSENENPNESATSSPGTAKAATARGEGFNWPEAFKDKTKRSPSFSSSVNPFAAKAAAREKAASVATVEPPKEMPKAVAPAPIMQKPDNLGERMLRGEFMMD